MDCLLSVLQTLLKCPSLPHLSQILPQAGFFPIPWVGTVASCVAVPTTFCIPWCPYGALHLDHGHLAVGHTDLNLGEFATFFGLHCLHRLLEVLVIHAEDVISDLLVIQASNKLDSFTPG